MQMTQYRFECFIAPDLRKVLEVLVEVMVNDMKIDFCMRRQIIEKLGFVVGEGVMCMTSDTKATVELNRFAGDWLKTYVYKYATLRTDESDINVVSICLVAQETVGTDVCYKPSTTVAARAGRDINREFITVDCNGVAQFVELNGQCANNALISSNAWLRSRFYLILEIKLVKHVATAENENCATLEAETSIETCADTSAVDAYRPETRIAQTRIQRSFVVGHESQDAHLANLRNIYEFAHTPCQIYTSEGVTEKVCCVPKECFNTLGTNGVTNSTDIVKLEEWHRCIKRTFLTIVINNLWLCGDKRLWLLRLDSDPKRVHEVNPALRNDTGMDKSAIDELRQNQVITNIKLIARCLRYFVGKGTQPKWRVQFKNHKTGRQSSGKAASPWHLICDTFEVDWGDNGDNLPVRTPVMIVDDVINAKSNIHYDSDIEDFLREFECNPLDLLKQQQNQLAEAIKTCRGQQPIKTLRVQKRKRAATASQAHCTDDADESLG